MNEATESGTGPAPRNGTTRDVIVKVSAGLVLAILIGTAGMVLAHESRVTVLETRDERIQKDLTEIKTDIKQLLKGQR